MPRWFLAGAAVASVAFLVVGAIALVRILTFPEQPLYERRSPPLPGAQSHHVGRVVLPTAPVRPVSCGAITGLSVQGGPETADLLVTALRDLCREPRTLDAELFTRIGQAARRGAVLSFANFGRTGELSTTVAGPPVRILLSDAFIRGAGQFRAFLIPVLAHELWHGGLVEIDAADELAARRIEAAVCQLVPSKSVFRGCTDAEAIVADPDAESRLVEAGYGR